jgi:hypothetical protein
MDFRHQCCTAWSIDRIAVISCCIVSSWCSIQIGTPLRQVVSLTRTVLWSWLYDASEQASARQNRNPGRPAGLATYIAIYGIGLARPAVDWPAGLAGFEASEKLPPMYKYVMYKYPDMPLGKPYTYVNNGLSSMKQTHPDSRTGCGLCLNFPWDNVKLGASDMHSILC